MKNLIFFLITVITALPLSADIGEGELSGYKTVFLKKIISDNPEKEPEIRQCMNGIIKDGHSGIKLIDKFGLFLYDSRNSGLELNRIRFFHDGNSYIFIISLRDSTDNSIYNLLLDYCYDHGRGGYKLADISFSMVFAGKMKSVTSFFGRG